MNSRGRRTSSQATVPAETVSTTVHDGGFEEENEINPMLIMKFFLLVYFGHFQGMASSAKTKQGRLGLQE